MTVAPISANKTRNKMKCPDSFLSEILHVDLFNRYKFQLMEQIFKRGIDVLTLNLVKTQEAHSVVADHIPTVQCMIIPYTITLPYYKNWLPHYKISLLERKSLWRQRLKQLQKLHRNLHQIAL